MARHPFGLTASDFTFGIMTVSGTDNVAVLQSSQLLFYNDPVAGSQYTDLALDAGGLSPVSSVTTGDGTGGSTIGEWPAQVYGPDGVVAMWVSADGGPRVLIFATDVADILNALSAAFAAHTASHNGHSTGFGDLTDVAIAPPASRINGDLVTWDAATGRLVLLPAAAVAGAVLLNGLNQQLGIGDPASGASGNPWAFAEQPYSAADTNPDWLQVKTTASGGAKYKCFWINGNGELRSAPSQPNRIGFRAFESYEANGLSTGLFATFSTNPTNSANREALLGVYGSNSSTKPGWAEATRVLSALQGLAAGGNFAGLSQLIIRGRSATAGPPTSGTWSAGDVVLDVNGRVQLCTASGTPGTWVGAVAPTAWTDVPSQGTNAAQGTPHFQYRIDGDVVRLKGQLTYSGAVGTLGVLPAGFRPPATVVFSARVRGTGAAGTDISVATNGTITTGTAGANGQTQNFDGLSFTTT